MSLPVEFLSGADADLQEAFNRYEDYREGLGVEFMLAVDAYLTRITTFPQIAPAYLETIRRQVMQRFPYGNSNCRVGACYEQATPLWGFTSDLLAR